MGSPQTAPFGTWKSPISIEAITANGVSLSEPEIAFNGRIFYLESRPAEGGRCVIVEYAESGPRDVLPKGYSARSAVHEYGGAAITLRPDGKLIFTDWETRGVFLLDPDTGETNPLVDADKNIRFANFNVHPLEQKWVLAVREDHRGQEVLNSVVVINGESKEVRTLAEGSDFYTQPQFNPGGDKTCWLEWNHPDMPWTGTVLFTAKWNNGSFKDKTFVAGKAQVESISQPRWNLDGSLLFASDKTGYWQLYHLSQSSAEPQAIRLKGLEAAEFSEPDWALGGSTYVPLTSDTVVATITQNAASSLIIVDVKTGTYSEPQYPLVEVKGKAIRRISATEFLALGKTAASPQALHLLDISKPGVMKLLASSSDVAFPKSLISKATHISFPRKYKHKDGPGHCFFLPPHNPDFEAPEGSLPPLITTLHGGPTAASGPGLSLVSQYWTSRGYAYVEINYAGSSGYGRAYRDLLKGNWGLSDVEDTANCIAYLSSEKLIDPTRVGIIGGSAGGYGVLAALCDYPTLFAGGISLYGVANVRTLVEDTHKFESRYADNLLFPLGASEEQKEKIMDERSPANRAGNIRAPTLLLQGLDDKVVPPSQAEEMEKAIRASGGEVKLIMFEGEGHGFRQSKNVLRAKQEEKGWWKKTLLRLEE